MSGRSLHRTPSSGSRPAVTVAASTSRSSWRIRTDTTDTVRPSLSTSVSRCTGPGQPGPHEQDHQQPAVRLRTDREPGAQLGAEVAVAERGQADRVAERPIDFGVRNVGARNVGARNGWSHGTDVSPAAPRRAL